MITYSRNLPHYHPVGKTFFITFRLHGSIPLVQLNQMKNQYEIKKNELFRLQGKELDFNSKLYSLQKMYFLKFDELLDKAYDSPLWLKDDRIAEIVSKKIFEFDNLKYELIVFCIMPNHVHFVIHPNEDLQTASSNISGKTKNYVIADIMRLVKGSTARDSNLILQRSGSFWHHESYDHVVRDQTELNNIIRYILYNPVKAGLVENWKDWKWNYCKYNV